MQAGSMEKVAAAAAAAKSLQSCPTLCNPRPWDSPGKNTGVGCHFLLQCMKVKSESQVAQSCPTLCDPMDCSLPGSSVYGIFQARVLEWGAIAFSSYKVQWLGLQHINFGGYNSVRNKVCWPISTSPLKILDPYAPHSSALAWRIPWAEEPGRLQSMESRRVRHD